jgi:DNA recombination protein RmuC
MQAEIIASFVLGALIAGTVIFLRLKMRILQLSAEVQLLQSQQKQQQDLEIKMGQQFELLAAKVMEDKSGKLTDLSAKSLSGLLDPFKEKLKDFEKKVDEVYSVERSERGNLRGELNKLFDLNIKMSAEAANLTRALTGDIKTQGNWGEMILENILDRSGLRKGLEYIVQASEMSLKNEEGHIIRPDVIINLPDQKHIIVDSKMSLMAYESYANAVTNEERDNWAKAHVDSLKKHIDGLAVRKYHTSDKLTSPDFVLLFMPLEPAFALAFKVKPELFQDAFEKGVAIVSPTTLLATLRTIAHIWKNERQERNAMEIAKRGGALYDKFVSLYEDFLNIGKKLEDASKAHQMVIRKMSDGPGNLLRQVDQLRELGVKTDKKIESLAIES